MIYLFFLIPAAFFIFNVWIEIGRSKKWHRSSHIPLFGGVLTTVIAWMIFREWWTILFILTDFGLVLLFLIWLRIVPREVENEITKSSSL